MSQHHFFIRVPKYEYEVSEELFNVYLHFGYATVVPGRPRVATVTDGYRVKVSPETGELLFTQEQLPEVKKLGELRSSWPRTARAALFRNINHSNARTSKTRKD